MMDQWGRNFSRIMLEVNKHTEGFVDAYYGEKDIKEAVDASPLIPIEDLQAELDALKQDMDTSNPQRTAFLSAMLQSAETALRLDRDTSLSYEDEVRLLFDITPQLHDEAKFKEAQLSLSDSLPNTGGSLVERLQAYTDHYNLNSEQLDTAIDLCLTETRQRTAQFIDLVEGEGFVTAVVKDKPWGAYNWYQGNAQSLIEFNTDIPVNALGMLDLCAHEGYPGHHTENMLKEKYLYQEQGRAEHAVVLLLSPAAVIAEGIATTALEIIFPNDTADTWMDEVLFPAIGIDPHPADVRQAIKKARKNLSYVAGNAALLHNTGQLSADATVEYLVQHTGRDEKRSRQMLRFITAQLSRAYIFTYTVGYDLIDDASDDKPALFKRLLTETMLPSDLVAMAKI